MLPNVNHFKYASSYDKNRVFEFLRTSGGDLNEIYIPDLVLAACLAYYMSIDTFMDDAQKEFAITNYGYTITKIAQPIWKFRPSYIRNHKLKFWSTAWHAAHKINSLQDVIATWLVKIEKCTSKHYAQGIALGIDICRDNEQEKLFTDKRATPRSNFFDSKLDEFQFEIYSSGMLCQNKYVSNLNDQDENKSNDISMINLFNDSERRKTHGIFGEGDLVSITLNLCQQEISFNINGQSNRCAFRNIQRSKTISYCFCVSLWYAGDCVTILNSCIHPAK